MASRKPRPFVDTNVLFAALYSSLGPPAAIVSQHSQGDITMVVSQQVLEELVALDVEAFG
jgi:predicted nucleic acid-binding protein